MSKHTPGPWHFVPWHIEEGQPAVRCAEGWIVATTSNDANAEFIARAPAMEARIAGLEAELESERAMNAALTEQLERAELARQDALAELVAARADAERMEWLAANKYSISYEPTPDDELGDGIEIVLFPMFPHMQKHVQAGSDLRKAIDAARGEGRHSAG